MRVNEIFHSLQGEGHFTGVPAIFVRLSGCNLKCDFCDTDHQPYSEMTEESIVERVSTYNATHVVITGGEPTLQLTASLIKKLHDIGKYVQIETNGTIPLDDDLLNGIDWITCSPKYGKIPEIQRIDELKVIYDHRDTTTIEKLGAVKASQYYLQPCDRGESAYNNVNVESCVAYILEHPKWRLSLQTHKILSIK